MREKVICLEHGNIGVNEDRIYNFPLFYPPPLQVDLTFHRTLYIFTLTIHHLSLFFCHSRRRILARLLGPQHTVLHSCLPHPPSLLHCRPQQALASEILTFCSDQSVIFISRFGGYIDLSVYSFTLVAASVKGREQQDFVAYQSLLTLPRNNFHRPRSLSLPSLFYCHSGQGTLLYSGVIWQLSV